MSSAPVGISPSTRHFITLLLLGAIWGMSFIFIRMAAPTLGAVLTGAGRALVGGLFLLGILWWQGQRLEWRGHMKPYLIVGFLNAGLPFFCFGYAGQHIPAGYSALMNATTPLFGALLATIFLNEKLTAGKILGIILGASGVALVAKVGALDMTVTVTLSILSGLVAAACYALTGIYIKRALGHIKSMTMLAMGSQLTGGLAMLPFTPLFPPVAWPDMTVILSIAVLGVLCTGIALMIFYQLMRDIGPVRASTVTFIVPMFAMIWAALFLKEPITLPMLAGMGLILAGTRFVLKK